MEIGYNEWLALIIGVILMMTGSQLFRGMMCTPKVRLFIQVEILGFFYLFW